MAPIRERSARGWSAWLLICICLLLAACSSTGTGAQTPAQPSGFHTTMQTTDRQYAIQFSVTPNRIGLNTFTLHVEDAHSGKAAPGLQARLTTTMLDMNMGTDVVDLQQNGPGQYSAQGTLSMAGRWDIHILLQTPDTHLHQATVELDVSP
jgi:copper transport protein